MPMIKMTDPTGKSVSLDPTEAIIVFFSEYLSPSAAKCNVVFAGVILSFRETPTEAAARIGAQVPLIKLTLPNTGIPGRAKGAIWLRSDKVIQVRSADGGAAVSLKGQKAAVRVKETKQQVDALLDAA